MARFVGTQADEVFAGTRLADVADGGAGNDTLSGGEGADDLAGGAGSDIIDGGADEDILYSGERTPEFFLPYYSGDYVAPLLDRAAQRDVLRGGGGSDRIFAGYGDDVDGGEGGSAGDYLSISFMGATSGVVADFSAIGAPITIGSGTITGIEHLTWVEGSDFDDVITLGDDGSGYADFTALFGMGGNDRLFASYYTGSMFGGDGNDVVDGRASQYLGWLSGGEGDDVIYAPASSFVTTDGGAGNDTIEAGGEIHGGDGDDLIRMLDDNGTARGGAGNDRIRGGSRNDIIFGGEGNDQIVSDGGIDWIAGDGGNDFFDIRSGDATIDGGTGNDRVRLSGNRADAFVARDGDVLTIATADSTVRLTGVETVVFEDGAVAADTLTGPAAIVGTAERDRLRGSMGDDIIRALAESDEIEASAGTDRIDAGAGDFDRLIFNLGDRALYAPLTGATGFVIGDGVVRSETAGWTTYFSGVSAIEFDLSYAGNFDFDIDASEYVAEPAESAWAAGLTIRTGRGDDEITGSAGGDTIRAGSGDDVLRGGGNAPGGADVDRLYGEGGNDRIFLGPGGGIADGDEGNDIIEGGVGDDSLTGGGGRDVLSGGDGDDDLFDISAGRDILNGGRGNDRLYSGDGPDILDGGEGDDRLDGGYGDDILRGGTGDDVFASIHGSDRIDGGSGADAVQIDMYFDSAIFRFEGAFLFVSTGSGEARLTGVETLEFYDGRYSVADLASDATLGTGGDDELKGTRGDDDIRAQGGDDIIRASSGTDRMGGGEGADRLVFTLSDSSLFAPLTGPAAFTVGNGIVRDAAGSFVTRFDGIESLTFDLRDTGDHDYSVSASAYAPAVGESWYEPLIVHTGAGDDRITGSGSNDRLWADGGSNVVNAGAGFDLVGVTLKITDAATSTIRIGEVNGVVTVRGAGNVSTIRNAENILVELADGSDPSLGVTIDARGVTTGLILFDGAGDDTVYGGDGDDLFGNNGGARPSGGRDVYTGGGGADTYDFVFATSAFDGTTITDFAAEDVIDLSYNVRPNGQGEPPAQYFIGRDAFTGLEGEVRYRFDAGKTLVEIDFDGDTAADATLTIANGTFFLGAFSSFEATFPYQFGLRIIGEASPIVGTDGVDRIVGTNGADVIQTLGGRDSVSAGLGDDDIEGGAGDDVLRGAGGNDLIAGGAGNDTLDGGTGDDRIDGGAGDDLLIGGAGDDDVLLSGDGNDRLTDFGASGLLSGGAGDDVFTFAGRRAVETTFRTVTINGGDGADTISLSGILSGGSIAGDAGNDRFEVRATGNAALYGGSGDDRLEFGGNGSFYFVGGEGRDTIALQAGAQGQLTLDFQAGEAGDRLDLSGYGASAFSDGTLRIEDRGYEVLIHDDANGIVFDLRGVPINQLSSYNLGIDTELYAPVSVVVEDWFFDENSVLYGYDADDILRGFGGDDALYGSAGADRLEGGSGNDRLDGGSGVDRMFGGAGDDIFWIDDAGDLTIEAAREGRDTVITTIDTTLRAQIERLVLEGAATTGNGNSLDNELVGNVLDNVLRGGDGADRLAGGGGADTLVGGAGADVFVFADFDLGARDRIADFASGDRIDLSAIDANTGLDGDQAFRLVGNAAFSGAAGELRYGTVGGRTVVEGDVNGDGNADWSVGIDGNVVLQAGDVIL